MQFKKATKKQAKLRMAFDGPAGSGKTYSSLLLAKLLGGRTAVIDSERGSASLYSDEFNFDVVELEEHSIDTYLKAIEAAKGAGYENLIVDSLSHAWAGKGGALEQVDRLSGTGGNKFSTGWRVVSPLYARLIDTLLAYPGNIIVTMRTKMEYVVEQNERGKATPRKVGLAPIQREGIEFEFGVVADLAQDGSVNISKTRCRALTGYVGDRKDLSKVAGILTGWLASGDEPTVQPEQLGAIPPVQEPNANGEPDEVEKIGILLGECSTVDELRNIVPAIQKLGPKAGELRDLYSSRMRELKSQEAT